MKKISKINKLVAVYARVSTDRQEKQETIRNQIIAMQDFCKEKGYRIVKEYRDDGWSGKTLVRPSLDELREDARSEAWEAVVIYDPDRLSRVYAHQVLALEELQEKRGKAILFVTSETPETPEQKMLYGMKGLFAEYERAKIQERFRLGKLRKIKEGHVLTSEAPYGYSYIPKKENRHGYYEINKSEARIVKKIFHWVADEGVTIRGVVKKLQELGVKPRKSKRGVWSTSTLSTLLRNTTYIGTAYYGKSYAVVPENPLKKEKYKKYPKTSRKAHSKEKWIAVSVPAIIDKELFERTQAQLKHNFEKSKRNRKNDYLLSGLLHCTCGSTRAGEGAQGGKHLYYRCTKRVNTFPLSEKCGEGGINAKIADKKVWERLVALMNSPALMEKHIVRWKSGKREKVEISGRDMGVIQEEITKLKQEGERYTKAYGAGVFTLEQLKEHCTHLREKISSLEKEIVEVEKNKKRAQEVALPQSEEIKNFARKAKQTLKELHFEEKHGIVKNIICDIVASQKSLQVSGHIPVSTINHVGLQTIHRHYWPSERRQVHLVQALNRSGDNSG